MQQRFVEMVVHWVSLLPLHLQALSQGWNKVVDLNAKFSSWATWKARDVNLGNWLILEKWVYPSWFNSKASNAIDEWTFCKALGTQCAEIASLKFNTLRIPVSFWAFIAPLSTESYIKSTKLRELSRVLGYAKTYNLTVVLCVHGLPGSQNRKEKITLVMKVQLTSTQTRVKLESNSSQTRAMQAI